MLNIENASFQTAILELRTKLQITVTEAQSFKKEREVIEECFKDELFSNDQQSSEGKFFFIRIWKNISFTES